MALRAMDFAGSWYPADSAACERQIRDWWERPLPEGLPPARLGVVPHAGWAYSGRLAARVFQALLPDPAVELVIVVGGHLRPSDPVVAMVEGEWETPFGPMPIHGGFRDELRALEAETTVRWETPQRYVADNSTELQVPFARYRYPRAELLPLRAPPGLGALALGRYLADYLERTGLNAVGVASTDLTHYGPAYGFEPQGRGPQAVRWVREENDPAFIDAVASGDGERVVSVANHRHCACSAGAVAALGEVARHHAWRFEPLDYATSDDVKPGDSLNFVGYVAGVYR
ncbi:MAG TPA: AmmeMemoRadiSam system protein B [bacterium]|nr:AmmeMemoRadiSam system protein B [bacterium]